jgi:glycine betaine/choline ABC-type transport system substrate-binding protein
MMRMLRTFRNAGFRLVLGLWSVAVMSGCANPDRIVIGSKNFTEQIILGELIAQHLETHTALEVDRRLNLGGTFVCHEGLIAGQLDIYVEYTGTALAAILEAPPANDPDTVLAAVREAYGDRFDVEWTEPLGFNNTFAIVVRGEDARRLGLSTISDVSPHTRDWKAGFGYEFIEREDGYPGLSRVYDFQFPSQPLVMDLGLTYQALSEGQIDLIAGDWTNGLIDALDLTILEDDLQYFPPYDAVPLIRRELIERHPEVREALSLLGGKITEDDMRQMNYRVDGERADVKVVVREFLSSLED